MAGDGEEETEYESDPEEAKLSLKVRRRREASDDEDESFADEAEHKKIDSRRDSPPLRAGIESDVESDGRGAGAEYDDEELEYGEEEEYYVEDEGVVVVDGYEEREGDIGNHEVGDKDGEPGTGSVVREGSEDRGPVGDGHVLEEKKENEPFTVPTAGAFYMHDDRFRDNAAGRNRRTFSGRKLWESKDDRKWGHDKFEEMNMQEKIYEERRRSPKVQYRGRGRGSDHAYARGGRSRVNNANGNQNSAPKTVRGRGLRRYLSLSKNRGEGPLVQNRQSTKPIDAPQFNSGRVNLSLSNLEPVKKVASSLSSASPPFYPSGSSKEIPVSQRGDEPRVAASKNTRPSITEERFSRPQSNSAFRAKNAVDSLGMNKLYNDESVSPVASKHLGNAPAYISMNVDQASQPSALGRGIPVSGPVVSHSPPMHNQKLHIQGHTAPRDPFQSRGQPLQPLAPPSDQLSSNSSQGSPPKVGVSVTTSDHGDVESIPESSNSLTALVAKGKGAVQGGGRGAFMYVAPQAVGSSGHADPKLPAYFPVMQFGGQPGVPALGMAFPGFVGNPQLGLGNSEMTWLPVLAGPAGPLGATYPYLAVEGSYHGRPTGQAFALSSPSKDAKTIGAENDSMPQPRSEPANYESSQTQNKPRRYSTMNFGQ